MPNILTPQQKLAKAVEKFAKKHGFEIKHMRFKEDPELFKDLRDFPEEHRKIQEYTRKHPSNKKYGSILQPS
jgi:hypothetical protein